MPTHGADTCSGAGIHARLPGLRALAAPGFSEERRTPCTKASGVRRWRTMGSRRCRASRPRSVGSRGTKMIKTEGRPFPGPRSEILDAQRGTLPPGELGAVVVNGPSRFLGFLGNERVDPELLDPVGRLPDGRPGLSRRERAPRVRRPQQGHHPPWGRHARPGRDRAARLRAPGDPGGRRRAAPGRPARRTCCAAIILDRGAAHPTSAAAGVPRRRRTSPSTRGPRRIEVFEEFPRTSSLKPVKRDVVKAIVDRPDATARG